MKHKDISITSYFVLMILLLFAFQTGFSKSHSNIIISCKKDNDLYRTLKNNNVGCVRYDTPQEAISKAKEGSGVLILADDYPANTTKMDTLLYEKSRRKKLRVYIEYPSCIPELAIGECRSTLLERVVVTTNAIENLLKMQILVLHDCKFISVKVENPLLAVGKVVGFDRAVYGLDQDANASAILFEQSENGLLISTTKLSHFITARYAPKDAMQALWTYILHWVEGDESQKRHLDWTPTVRPSFTREEKLPVNVAHLAIQRGIDWYTNAKMLLSEQGWNEYKQLWRLNDSNMHKTIPSVNSAVPIPKSVVGDGKFGVLEGIASQVYLNGSQPGRWWLRSDANGESSLAFALKWKIDGDKRSKAIAENLLDWVYFNSGLFQKDPKKANYGLINWAPGNDQALYQDNDVKVILGCMGTSGILHTDKWDKVLIENILGNFRTTGKNGFRGCRLENPDVLRKGWEYYWNRDIIQLQPHYEAWTWASYLWLYDKTKWTPLLEKTRKAIKLMMKGYPKDWRWTNGIQQERSRMLLALSWLIRVEDRPEYRAWLKQIATDMEKCQDRSGAIREELGALDHGDMVPPTSNAAYGTNEAPLIQENGDKVSDLLYTCNFASLGLIEAYAVTGDEQYKRMADRLAEFFIRVQVRSEKHKELDGGWFRAFDYRQWEYWGSNADSGWGAWSIEVGWTQAWIPTMLSLIYLKTDLWSLTQDSKVAQCFEQIQKQMIPDETLLRNYKFNEIH